MVNFEREKSSTDIINNATMSVDEVVASDVPPRYLLDTFSLRVYPSVRAVCPHFHCGKTAEKRGGEHSECMPIQNGRFYLPAWACFS